jgi:hypothetical protein
MPCFSKSSPAQPAERQALPGGRRVGNPHCIKDWYLGMLCIWITSHTRSNTHLLSVQGNKWTSPCEWTMSARWCP